MSRAPQSAPMFIAALRHLGHWLEGQGYQFICPSPETHARVNARPHNDRARSLSDVFGWSRPFPHSLLPRHVLDLLRQAAALDEEGSLMRSRIRFSSVHQCLLAHSAFPTNDRNAVFLGPDTYRFVDFIQRCLQERWSSAVHSLADIGCGSGAGAILAAEALDRRSLRRVVFSDVNSAALEFSQANVALNNNALSAVSDLEFAEGPSLSASQGQFDLIVSDPPYMVDSQQRTYCHGGGRWGIETAVEILRESLTRLNPGGRLLLYTGTPVVNGQDVFRLAILPLLEQAHVNYRYFEIDPDVFSEDLQRPQYAAVDRIAVIGLVASPPGGPL